MPELPEVEVSRLGIAPHVEQHTMSQFIVRNPNLRWPVDAHLTQLLKNALITHTSRRGKYLILHAKCVNNVLGVLMIHLGMSGSLRIVAHDTAVQKHDHIDWVFASHRLRYRDPRRFGSVLWHDEAEGDYLLHPRLVSLGIEPFDEAFDGGYFYERATKRSQAIKVVLLGGEIVVGVGNIYASEVLFNSKIHPATPANQLTRRECKTIAKHVKKVLSAAIARGGSTLKDFVHSDGSSGYFQLEAHVYDRANLPCLICKTPIERIIQAQRATYFCPHCQPERPNK
jgi:formamidopyrimidine-DNA glycosylase